ncbi:unnamed protein product [Nesidiocoris tenuis]|uniref:Metallo-beta-lactamase domain-containing protein 1 n=3 Tax=Nesidiocoris tenuis TaxID=355587 RepID=A0A6H5GXC5_9HEMI|nr:Metallo-beta-lactamase superfamily [Nesidiocoris tenuis]CAB0008473.1 unnamed protein product [Nesidiocoris tenuis]
MSARGRMETYEVRVLHEGYSRLVDDVFEANCTCTLITGPYNIIVDTMTPWDGNYILKRLKEFDLTPGDIQFVISTHGHSDHVGNNNLFLSARHIVGRCISYRTTYFDEPFSRGDEYVIDPESLRVISTPGHTLACVTVLVKTDEGLVAIAGDLFEKLEDVYNEYVWLGAGSENPDLQRHNRAKIIQLADYIIPGHGPRFKVTKEMKEKFKP